MPPEVIVVGAGIAGLSCAAHLARAGMRVRVLDKARGPGGRLSTRRDADAQWDHGAQYFTARDRDFSALIRGLAEDGIVARWQPRMVTIEGGVVTPRADAGERWVGAPRMSALTRALSRELDVETGVRVSDLRREGGALTLFDERGRATQADVVLLTVPAAQALPLVEGLSPSLASAAAAASLAPCWAVMCQLEGAELGFDAARIIGTPLSWAARDGSKPGRPDPATWVLHASPAWSRAHLEDAPEAVARALVAAFGEAVGRDLAPSSARAHRWRYALAESEGALGGCLLDVEAGVGVAGDWCLGARVESAWLSGRALARWVAEAW